MRWSEQLQRLPRGGARHLRGQDRLAGVLRTRSCASRTRYGRGPGASRRRGNEFYDEGRRRGIDEAVDWARLEAEARKIIETGLELAGRVEAA